MTQTEAQLHPPVVLERIYRSNFIYFLADSILFTVAMGIISPTTVIPDFVRRLTDSEILIGLSGSLFTIGFTLPQLFIARYIIRHAKKKWWFVGPNIPVRFVILIFAALLYLLGVAHPGLILAAFFIAYSIAAFGDGLVGVPWMDLIGTSLDNRWRARMLGLTTVTTGGIMLLVAPLIGYVLSESGPAFPQNYAVLFGAAGAIFLISILPGLFIHELPGGRAVEKLPALSEFLPSLGQLLRDDMPFRAYILVRIFTSLFLMAAPFYVGFATVDLGLSSEVAVPVLLAMQTAGSLLGALLYTWVGARHNLLFIRLALVSAVLIPICALLAGVVGPLPLYFAFLISGVTVVGNLFNAYTNWLVTYAHPDQRPIYVGLANTISAVVSFIAPILGGALAQALGYRPLFAVSMAMAGIALFVALRYLRDARAEEAVKTATA